jgi:hypothetical protein
MTDRIAGIREVQRSTGSITFHPCGIQSHVGNRDQNPDLATVEIAIEMLNLQNLSWTEDAAMQMNKGEQYSTRSASPLEVPIHTS